MARDSYDLTVVDAASIFPTNRNMIDPISISVAADGVGVVMTVLTKVTHTPNGKTLSKASRNGRSKITRRYCESLEKPII